MEDALGFICGGCCSVVATQIQYLICGTRKFFTLITAPVFFPLTSIHHCFSLSLSHLRSMRQRQVNTEQTRHVVTTAADATVAGRTTLLCRWKTTRSRTAVRRIELRRWIRWPRRRMPRHRRTRRRRRCRRRRLQRRSEQPPCRMESLPVLSEGVVDEVGEVGEVKADISRRISTSMLMYYIHNIPYHTLSLEDRRRFHRSQPRQHVRCYRFARAQLPWMRSDFSAKLLQFKDP